MSRAFTLIELVLVLAIVVIISAVGLPYLWDRDQALLNHELEHLELLFTFMQQQALATNKPCTLVVQPPRIYTFTRNGRVAMYQLAPGIEFGTIPGAYGPPANPTGPLTQAATFPPVMQAGMQGFEVVFLPNCQTTPGAVYLKATKSSFMGALTCAVSQVSYIRRYLYKAPSDPRGRGTWVCLTA
jgi:prepilin-type N-terminal cleavage/methylation domain-containing protein